jgi:hypothetical protein
MKKQAAPRAAPLQLALTNGGISIPVMWSGADSAGCKSAHGSINAIGFLLGQLTSAFAAEYAIILVHTFTPSCVAMLPETMNSAGNAVPDFENGGADKAPP